jgi:hypothetical protein
MADAFADELLPLISRLPPRAAATSSPSLSASIGAVPPRELAALWWRALSGRFVAVAAS